MDNTVNYSQAKNQNEYMQNIYIKDLNISSADKTFKAGIGICRLHTTANRTEVLHNLHPLERDYYNNLTDEERKISYLLGRYSAKQAIFAIDGQPPQNTLIKHGLFNQPVCTNTTNQNIQVSISHCENIGTAVAFPEVVPMGIDIERINPEILHVFERQMTEKEKELIKTFDHSYIEMLVVLWTAKEALSKVLKTGLKTPFKIYEIKSLTVFDNHIICNFRYFKQYKGISFILNSFALTVVYPKNTDMDLDINYQLFDK